MQNLIIQILSIAQLFAHKKDIFIGGSFCCISVDIPKSVQSLKHWWNFNINGQELRFYFMYRLFMNFIVYLINPLALALNAGCASWKCSFLFPHREGLLGGVEVQLYALATLPLGKEPPYTLKKMLGGSQSQSHHTPDHPVCNIVTILTVLPPAPWNTECSEKVRNLYACYYFAWSS